MPPAADAKVGESIEDWLDFGDSPGLKLGKTGEPVRRENKNRAGAELNRTESGLFRTNLRLSCSAGDRVGSPRLPVPF